MQRNVLEYLERTAGQYPDKPAFVDEHQTMTFAKLLAQAQAVGSRLARAFPGRNRPVAVLAERSASAVAGFMGALYSGNFYVPVDPKAPAARRMAIVETLDPVAVLYASKDEAIARACGGNRPLLCLEEAVAEPVDGTLLAACRAAVLDVDPVYAIFTSGSTGTPKGIVVSHRSVIDFVDWYVTAMGITAEDRLGNQAPFYFDLSVKNLYTTLKCGATTHLLPQKFFMFPKLLTGYLTDHAVTVLSWATSAFHLVANSGALDQAPPGCVRLVIVGGEALQAKQLNCWRRALPETQYVNLYGPTEVTVDCTWYPIDRTFADTETVPIGRACENKEVFLLTDDNRLAQPGEPGEICVRGSGLAQGYYGDWEKSAAAFTQNPLNPWYFDRIYRTGDIAVADSNGLLRFLSRRDNQIKHGGYRIELGEIETALNGIPGVLAAVCLFDQARDRIVCFYEGEPEPQALAKSARAQLPKYMLPNQYRQLAQLPYNANGKIDRVALSEALS